MDYRIVEFDIRSFSLYINPFLLHYCSCPIGFDIVLQEIDIRYLNHYNLVIRNYKLDLKIDFVVVVLQVVHNIHCSFQKKINHLKDILINFKKT